MAEYAVYVLAGIGLISLVMFVIAAAYDEWSCKTFGICPYCHHRFAYWLFVTGERVRRDGIRRASTPHQQQGER